MYKHTHTHTCIYVYVCVCVCVCTIKLYALRQLVPGRNAVRVPLTFMKCVFEPALLYRIVPLQYAPAEAVAVV